VANEPPAVAVLHRVATHVLARARFEATGQISLRATPGGLGTPAFGDAGRRIRIAGSFLVVEQDAASGADTTWCPLDGSTLRQLADVAGVDLDPSFSVGPDTVPLGDPDEPIVDDAAEVASVGAWYGLVAEAVDRVLTSLPPSAAAGTVARLWPEHFDLAVDAGLDGGDRVNLGGSPGDGFSPEPYVYVGPWSAARPGDTTFWNAPFGAVRTRRDLGAEPAEAAVAFLREGFERLAAVPS